MKSVINLIILFVLVVFSGNAQERPNIVYINIDDLGWTDLACYGSTYYETPNIDQLVSRGMMFTDAYASASNCAPSRAGLMSGQYSPRYGIYTVGTSERGRSKDRKLIPVKNNTTLPDSIVTLAEVLKNAGYITASMGKWHLGDDPKTQGFDINVGGTHAGHPKSYFSPYRNKNLKDGPVGEYLTDRLTKEGISFIRTHKDEAFFLYMTYYTVHTPLQGKKEIIQKYKNKPVSESHNNATYAAMVETMDTNVGRLIKILEELDLIKNTLIIFTSDNGGLQTVSKQTPLKYGKGSYYEGGTRVPLIVRWDGRIKPKTVSKTPVINLDFYPTLLEISNISPEKDQILDGKSLVPVLFDQKELEQRPLFWHFPVYLEAGKGFDELTGRDVLFRTRPGSAMRYGKWKLHQYFEDGAVELYDLENDITEKHDLSKNKPEITTALLKILDTWREEVNAPVPEELNPDYIHPD
jgi:arylsulfatase A-like enzyme